MKTIIFAGSFLAVSLLAISPALAHSPNVVDGYYDVERGELNITVQHIVNDPKDHFIKEVVVYKDGKEVAKKEFDFQTSHRNQTMPPFKIPASIGDSFKVEAICSVSGKGEVVIEVKDEKPDVRKLN
ncbi:MAG: hypothetical protein WC683_13465 [bacterium]